MASSMERPASERHLDKLDELKPSPAKANLNPIETNWRSIIGGSVQRCFSLAGLSQKEAAAIVGRDQAQVARWISGAERAQLDAIFAIEQLRQPLIIALAEVAGVGVEIETVLRMRRRA